MAFSVERLKDKSKAYRLFPSGRYAHSRTYIQDCLRRHGLQFIEESKADIRKESGNQVKGLLIVAKKDV
jgi:predicted TPR repeat methyltransferase